MRKIAIYGKGGIGKSTTVSNLAVAFKRMGYNVLLIGCDPKADSSRNLANGENIQTVLDLLRDSDDVSLEEIVYLSSSGVHCVEAGGPLPGIGCAGRGIISAFEKLDELEAYDVYKPDIILYDVLGDVVCGGFAMPIRGGYAKDVFIVTSGEMMSLYAASNISSAIDNFSKRGYARLSGLILNSKNIENEVELVSKAAQEINSEIIHIMPRDGIVQAAEDQGKTVVEAYPESAMTQEYLSLSQKILDEVEDDE